MLITERKFGRFKIANIFFVDEPVPVVIPNWNIITYHTKKNWGEINGFERQQYVTTIIDLSQDIDVIWKNIKRQHKRHIHRAEKNGIEVTVSDNYKEFHKIYEEFLKQKNYIDPFGLNIFSLQFMQQYGLLFLSEHQGEILGGNFYFYDNHNALIASHAYQQFGNSIDKNKQISDANCYIHWIAIQYFKNMGVINYNLAGLEGNGTSINHQIDGLDYYKLNFGGKVVPQYRYIKFNSQFDKILFHIWNNQIQPKK